MNILPEKIERLEEQGIRITWSDKQVSELSSELLRRNCPAADSKAERGETGHDKPLTAKKSLLQVVEHTKDEQLRLEEIWAIGNYAIGIRWGDGHDTGIYSYELLAELGGLISHSEE